jgi:hypothetical protein
MDVETLSLINIYVAPQGLSAGFGTGGIVIKDGDKPVGSIRAIIGSYSDYQWTTTRLNDGEPVARRHHQGLREAVKDIVQYARK